MNTNFLKTFLKLLFFPPSPATPIIFTAFLIAGATLVFALLSPSTFTEAVREVSQVVPTEGANTYGTRGIRVPLPSPNEEVKELVKDGWILDLPDNNDHTTWCRHKIIVNGIELSKCSNHSQIAESLQGACSVWGVGLGATVHMSLPKSSDHIQSMTVQWHLSRKSGVVRTEQEEQSRGRLGLVGIFLCCIGSIGIALSLLSLRKNWATWLLAVAAGSAVGLAVGCWLIGPTDTSGGLWLSTFISQTVLIICLFILILGLMLSVSVRWLNPFFGLSAPAITILALTLGVSVASLASGWVSSKQPISPYDNSGPASVLFAGRIPFSDAGGWFAGMSAVNNGQPVQWVARRPVHALIRSGEFEIARGNYQWSLLIQAAVFSLAVSALTIAAWSAITPAVALIIWGGAFRVGQGFLCSYLTESVGYSCACLSLAYLLAGCKDNRFGVRLAGIAWLGMAWLTRPGPLGLLAVPIVLEVLAPFAHRFRRMAIAVAVLASVLIGGKAMFQLVAADSAAENANAAPTIYGLAIGKSWDAAYKAFYAESPERAKLGLQEQTALMYRESWKKFIANPMPALNKSLTDLGHGFEYSIISLPGRLWIPLVAMVSPRPLPGKAIGWILFISGALTAAVMIKRKSLVGLVLFGSVIGLIVSLPIIWGDGGLRGVIIATPSLIVFLSLLWAIPESVYGRQAVPASEGTRIGISHACGAVMLAVLAIGLSVYTLRKSPTIAPATPMTITIGEDPSVFISEKYSSSKINGAAMLTKADAVQSVKDRGMSVYKLDDFLNRLGSDALIVFKFHSETASQMLVIENAGSTNNGKLIIEATAPTTNPYFIKATKWHWVEK
jgi:hypothetical protein